MDCAAFIFLLLTHEEHNGLNTKNLPMQYTEIIFSCKNKKFHWKKFDVFNKIAQNIDCGYTELPQQGSSVEYPQSIFWIENKKNRYTPAYPIYVKVRYKVIFIARTCLPDECGQR